MLLVKETQTIDRLITNKILLELKKSRSMTLRLKYLRFSLSQIIRA